MQITIDGGVAPYTMTFQGVSYILNADGVHTINIPLMENTTFDNTSVTVTDNISAVGTITNSLTIHVHPTYNLGSTPELLSVCEGDSITWHGNSYNTAGTYADTLTTIYGCDSIIYMSLTVNPLPSVTISGITTILVGESTTLTAHGANSYLWSNGETAATITVTPTVTTSYSVIGTNEQGCEATAYITVTVTDCQLEVATLTDTACDSYTWYGTEYTVSGNYSHTIIGVAAGGCDSVYTLNLTIYTTFDINITTFICEGDSIIFNGVYLSTPGAYQAHFISSSGCDSTVTCNLLVNPTPTPIIYGANQICIDSTITLTTDSGYTYLWNTGETTQSILVNAQNTYHVTVTDSYGCSGSTSHSVVSAINPIISVNKPDMCAGVSYLITVGKQAGSTILIGNAGTSQMHTDTIFLPDGINCPPYGCSYISSVEFTAFNPTATIRTADDILWLRILIEHSYIGDIYIRLVCPNDNYSVILKKYNSGSSDCSSSIPAEDWGWLDGENHGSAYLGAPIDDVGGGCTPTPMGIGWNYCWSNSTNQGYEYAPGDGIIYRSVNVHNGKVDSTNVAEMTNVYHPDESFDNLIGCPLNGTWSIEVMDGYTIDNGYLFGWELSLTPELLPFYHAEVTYTTASGPWIQTVNDSSFIITPPANLPYDTIISYTFSLYDENGCRYDTVININVFAINQIVLTDTIMADQLPYSWNGEQFSAVGSKEAVLQNQHGCDSIVSMHLSVIYGIDTFVCQNNLPLVINGYTFHESDTITTSFVVDGADSIIRICLISYPVFNQQDTHEICHHEEFIWHDIDFSDSSAGVYIVYDSLTTWNGCDSLFMLHLTVNPLLYHTEEASICNNDTYTWNDTVLFALTPGQYTFYNAAVSQEGCDSVLILHLLVLPSPIEQTIVGGGKFCEGDNGRPLGLSGSEIGTTYQLYRSNSLLLELSGTGEAIVFGTFGIGNYSIKAISANGCEYVIENIGIQKTPIPPAREIRRN